ncbi:IS110 family transposase [Loigolactobacillus coryniformis]|uniref:IS110 family transposase n=4 Tax=Loigolactobacillus coryniformis TaxID=1610 RepID=UPI001C602A1B|nr:IS110 family transposase [Loigolactobacillus coryniformis]MBW4803363.1 IS110 family transposase [Loigolactobacillus coryniformis subsp. torquens]MBW4806059.1 IS110 family transposase [Loigolactobacillus coryniformis subsp. torquens]
MSDVFALDVSKGHSYGVWYRGDQCLQEFECIHNKLGFAQLDQMIKQADNPVVYFEATGVYSQPLVRFCQDHQLRYGRLNPLELHLHSESLRRVKTDQKDAHRIALSVMQHQYRLTTPWPPEYAQLRQLNRFYQQVMNDVKRMRLKLYTALQQTFPEVEELFSSRVSKLALNVILLFPHPDLVRGISRTCLKNKLMRETDKKLSPAKGLKYAEKLIAFAKDSYPAADADSIQVQEVQYYCRQLIESNKQEETLRKQMTTAAAALPQFQIYQSMPGIGALSAAQLVGELGDILRFDNANQVNAYVGIDLNRYQSGKYMRQDHINKRGNAHARALLYLIVRNMIRQKAAASNHIVDYYGKLKSSPISKRDKVAIVACMNKTLKCLYAMVLTGTKYRYRYTDSKSTISMEA